jgi:hypothetical protein
LAEQYLSICTETVAIEGEKLLCVDLYDQNVSMVLEVHYR